MKKLLIILTMLLLFGLLSNAQTKKDGTPDMRFKANKQVYDNNYSVPKTPITTYSAPKTERKYTNGGQIKVQKGYIKRNATYVEPHLKTTPDNNKWNNLKNNKL
jgi:hypothetical protein